MRSSSITTTTLYLGELVRVHASPSNDNSPTSPPPQQSNTKDLSHWEKVYLKVIRVGYSARCHPVYYDAAKGAIRINRNKLVLFMWMFQLAGILLDNLYLFYISSKVTLKSVGEKEFMDFWTHLVSRNLGGILALLVAVSLQGTVQVFNTMVATRRTWRDKFGTWSADFSGPLEQQLRRFCQIGGIFGCIQPIFPLLMHFDQRQSMRYWGSQLIPTEMYNSIPGILIFGANDFLLSTVAIQNVSYGGTIVMSFFVLIRFWTTSIIENVSSYSRSSSFDVPLRQYRCLLILARIYNCCLGQLIVPYIIFGTAFMLTVLYSILIKGGRSLPIFVTVNMALAALLLTYTLCAALHGAGRMLKKSRDLKHLFARERDLRRRKFLRSCQEMRIDVGQFFYVKEGTFPTAMKWIMDQTITIIFALQ